MLNHTVAIQRDGHPGRKPVHGYLQNAKSLHQCIYLIDDKTYFPKISRIRQITHQTLGTIKPTARGFMVFYMYLLVFIHLEDTISFSPSRYVKSLLPSLLSVPSPFDVRNERHYPRKFRSSLPDKMSIMSGSNWPILDETQA